MTILKKKKIQNFKNKMYKVDTPNSRNKYFIHQKSEKCIGFSSDLRFLWCFEELSTPLISTP